MNQMESLEITQPIRPRPDGKPVQAVQLPEPGEYGFVEQPQQDPCIPFPPQPIMLSEEAAKALSEELRERKIQFLTHFTRVENLASIMTHGLLPRSRLVAEGRARSIRFNEPYLPGAWQDAISFNISFPNYRLFYNLQEQRGVEWVVLLLDASLLLSQPFYYFLFPAANLVQVPSFPIEFAPYLQSVEMFRSLFSDTDNVRRAYLQIPDNYPTHPQSEVLTFSPIPPSSILEVHFYNTYKFSQWFLQNTPVALTIDKNIWVESLEYFSPRIDYPHWKSTFR